MKLSIIIPLFNQLKHTQAMYKSLIETLPTDLDVEIIFVDDASTDETTLWLNTLSLNQSHRENVRKVKFIRNSQNLGYAKSNNLAVEAASGELLALLNNDLILMKGWLEPMLSLICQSKNQPAIVGNLQYRLDTGQLDHAGVVVSFDSNSKRVLIGHRREIIKTGINSIFAVTGACCLVSRATFMSLGGFDEVYVNGGEDIDLCLKIKNSGGFCYMAYNSAVMHHVSLTRGHIHDRDELNSWHLFKKWEAYITHELEYICALQLINSLSDNELIIKNMIHDFVTDNRNFAPMLVKFTARKLFQNEIDRLASLFIK